MYISKLLIFFTVLAVMYTIEKKKPKRSWEVPHGERFAFHFTLSIFNTIMTRILVVGPLLWWIHVVNENQWGFRFLFGLQGLPEIVATFIIYDGYDYWWHRFNHKIPFLWRFHQVHHMDTAVDVTTSLRFHPGELILSYFAKSVWILVWGPSMIGFVLCEIGITAFSQFHHANIDLGDKWEKRIRAVHMTPRVHASHHTVTPRTREANYSTIFLIWDKIFGTLKEPDVEEMKELGLPVGRDIYLNFFKIMKAPLSS